MVKVSKFSKEEKFEVLWDCGICRATTPTRLSRTPLRTTYRYMERIKNEGILQRHNGCGRKNKITKKVEGKVIKK